MSLTRHDPMMALDQTIMRLESLLYTPHGDDEGFDLHSLNMPEFLRGMAACGEPGTFMDLGCGIGTKLVVAQMLGWTVAGIERHEDYAAAARLLVPEAEIQCADVNSPTLISLYDYDVVYSYRLMVDLDAQQVLNRRIVSMMRRGSLYFCAGSDPEGLEEVGGSVWRVA